MAESGVHATDLVAELETHSRREDSCVVEEVGMLPLDGQRLMFLFVRPRAAPRRTGLVLCHSLFEFKMLQSAEIALARAAARKGFASIYMEAPGTGDSEGSLEECTIDARIETAHAGAEELKARVPEVERICMFGARLGAAVAALAAQQTDREAALAIWDPAFKADDYWKQTKRFARVVAAMSRQRSHVDPDRQLALNGRASLLGYTVTKRIVDDLARINVVTEGPELHGPTFVLSLNDQMASGVVTTVSLFASDVEGVSLGRPKPRHVIHMGLKEAVDALNATVSWMERRLR